MYALAFRCAGIDFPVDYFVGHFRSAGLLPVGCRLAVFRFCREPDLDEAADGLGAAGLVVLTGSPCIDAGAKVGREANGGYGVLARAWSPPLFSYYVFY